VKKGGNSAFEFFMRFNFLPDREKEEEEEEAGLTYQFQTSCCQKYLKKTNFKK
jgi:hypothetical protein